MLKCLLILDFFSILLILFEFGFFFLRARPRPLGLIHERVLVVVVVFGLMECPIIINPNYRALLHSL